jgi:hypothetical protein
MHTNPWWENHKEGSVLATEYTTVKSVENQQTFRSACYLVHARFFLGLFFDPENGGEVLLRNVG